jgi:CheY-like chemotaxis protein
MCCYYPTTTVVIDDDKNFLKALIENLNAPDYRAYTSPKPAIESTRKYNNMQRICNRVIKANSDANISSPEDKTITFKLRALHEEIYNGTRFDDVSVIIVDYYMDEMNGIEVCEALAKHPAKKILLTGGADMEALAIGAFNKGIIHYFISKSDPLFPSKIKQAIASLKHAYFRDLTAALIPHLPSMPLQLHQFSPYINFTQSLRKQLNIVEHYIVDATGSTLMLDADGNKSWLIVKHESEMQDMEILAQDQDAPEDLIQGIKERTLIPFFLSDKDFNHPASEWRRFFHPGQPLTCAKDYYYAIYSGDQEHQANQLTILSYNSYHQIMDFAK